ncbi:MAG: helix-turn-helix transcriptional regulator, partial [Oscillospiraceae bacterium]|nr:helix-turn-helix transcriptional regulator [Oscillospiraceae bacterium]
YAEDIRIRHIAQSAAVSESECLRCFRALIGSTPNRYLNQYRLRRAGQLLRGTELKVAEIAEACGFREMSYFARAFRLAYGVAPSEYRRYGDRSPEPGA